MYLDTQGRDAHARAVSPHIDSMRGEHHDAVAHFDVDCLAARTDHVLRVGVPSPHPRRASTTFGVSRGVYHNDKYEPSTEVHLSRAGNRDDFLVLDFYLSCK